jgi:HD-GYP domain-containing protein (c-di-GMP phosphodiesterase class II)
MKGTPKSIRDLVRIDSELNKIQDYDLLLERILLEARKVANADAGSIYLKEGDNLTIKYSQNDTLEKRLPSGEKLIYNIFSIPISEKTISGYVAKSGELVNIPDAYDIPEGAPYGYDTKYDRLSGYKTTSMLTLPLDSTTGSLLGVIQLINSRDAAGETIPFSKDCEVVVTHFAANASLALQRAAMTRAMILRMIRMAELRDPKETGAHVNRVAGYAVELYDHWAFKHKVGTKERDRIKDNFKLAAMLHDVGKVAISDIILKKPSRFTPEEYRVMQAHTLYGARLFDDLQSELDRISAEVALTHHENWDGTGYPGWVDVATGQPSRVEEDGTPMRRRGAEIPLFGRIVAIADVYDALVSVRVYKEAWDEERVLQELKNLAGTKFDPELVGYFLEIYPRIKQIRSRYPDQE